ncbi:hypothetical protein [Lonepinella sp. BR2919]|uniref:hypothetical protein n=1 Tax=unclassified Lonepinella TaxID=2642006 RepID=UPI003F6E324F
MKANIFDVIANWHNKTLVARNHYHSVYVLIWVCSIFQFGKLPLVYKIPISIFILWLLYYFWKEFKNTKKVLDDLLNDLSEKTKRIEH